MLILKLEIMIERGSSEIKHGSRNQLVHSLDYEINKHSSTELDYMEWNERIS